MFVVMLAATAHAQPSDKVGIERFRLAVDRDSILDVEWAGVPRHLAWSAGAFVGFAHAPLVVYDRDMNPVDALVDRRVTTSLVGSIALFGRLEVGAALDVIGYQSGADVLATMESLPAGGLGDARLVTKLSLLATEQYQLAIVPAVTIPGGSAGGYLREAGVTFSPAFAAAMRIDRFRLATNLGYHVKPRVDSAGLVSDDEAFARVAAGAEVGPAELWLATSIATPISDAERNQVAIELLAGGSYRFTPMLDAFVAGGIGLDNGFGTPDWRALAGVRFGTAPPAPLRPTRSTPLHERVLVDKPIVAAKATLAGTVVDAQGRALPGATVRIVHAEQPSSAPIELVADGEGAFTTELEPGRLEVTAHAAEFEDGVTQVIADAGKRTPVTIELVRAIRQGQLRGQVLAFDGKPLAATISVKGATTGSVTADASGQFAIDLPEGAFTVEISSPGHVTQKRNVSIKLDGVTVLNVDMRRGK